MGDKSQLAALAFATRFSAPITLLGITLATLLVHAFSVVIGQGLGLALPTVAIQIGSGLAFIGFGAWTLRGDQFTDDQSRMSRFGPLLTVTITFFLAELGDKTMLATITLASQEQQFVAVWLGSTLGMVLADALAIAVGVAAGKHFPERAIKLGAAAIFLGFGLWSIGSAFWSVSHPPPAIAIEGASS
jgi:Ca2+/H+ antiporter, TMEM165/GDT1 family